MRDSMSRISTGRVIVFNVRRATANYATFDRLPPGMRNLNALNFAGNPFGAPDRNWIG